MRTIIFEDCRHESFGEESECLGCGRFAVDILSATSKTRFHNDRDFAERLLKITDGCRDDMQPEQVYTFASPLPDAFVRQWSLVLVEA